MTVEEFSEAFAKGVCAGCASLAPDAGEWVWLAAYSGFVDQVRRGDPAVTFKEFRKRMEGLGWRPDVRLVKGRADISPATLLVQEVH